LFKKAGIVRCYGRSQLVSVATIFEQPEGRGKNFAIVTHAGGPAVMLTDALSKGGLKVPEIKNEYAKFLLDELYPGSSVSNPIDFLATGTAEQLCTIIEYVNKKFDEIDAMVVIFGTPGLFKVFDAYKVLDEKMKISLKPIYPVLPSGMVAREEVADFVSKGNAFFSDEVVLGEALAKVYNTPKPADIEINYSFANDNKIRQIINESPNGYIDPVKVQQLLDSVGIPAFLNKASTATSELANAPVCEEAARLPASELPALIAAILHPLRIKEAACLSNICGLSMFSR